MDQYEKPVGTRQDQRRKGQALAEFAITLPILLLLLFGIIEFGRLFQAWVTLQNAARTAARYASTGQYFEDLYNINEIVPCDVVRDPITLEIKGGTNSDKGTPAQLSVDYGGQAMQIQFYQADNDPNTLQEDLFTSWYGLNDCKGGDPEHQQLQRDILRIVSIYEEARRGAAGLAIEDTRIPTRDDVGVKAFLYEVWQRPQPGRDRPGWFNVMICSDRGPLLDDSRLVYGPNASDELAVGTRFLTMLEPADAYTMRLNYDNEPGREFDIPPDWAPSCVLREKPLQNSGFSYNVGIPWIDPGGPGDTVTIVVSFNHPLITPLGFAPFIPLQARRTAVNEAFRTADVPLFNPPGEGIGSVPELGSPTPTDVPATNTPLPPTETPLPATNTPLPPTQEPFDCNKIKAQNVTFFANRYYIEFTNNNTGANANSWLVKSIIIWQNDAMKTDYPEVGIGLKALEGEIYFIGAPDKVSPTDSSNPADGSYQAGAFLEVPGNGATVRWEGVFVQGPPLIATYMQPWDFTGTTFWFDNPETSGINADCAVTLILPPTPPPTPTPDPNVTPTATYTPDCASTSLRVEFVSFDPLGDVRLRVVNNRTVVAPLTDFNIAWREPSGRDIFLVKVVAGGNNANDLPQFGGNGTIVWQGTPQDNDPPTRGRQEGAWVTNYTFPPNSSTFLHLDFSGIGNLTLAQVGISASDFNGTWFDIGCGSGGSTAGTSGGGQTGTIFLSEVPSPVPTNTPRPTNTPGPTLTPSNTFTPAPPTKTWTPAPPTFTFTPQPATATPTQTPFVVPTVPGIGGGDAGS